MKFLLRSSMSHVFAALPILWLIGSIVGCDSASPVTADRLRIVAGDNQTGFPGELVAQPLVVRALGPRNYDLLGRRKDREPAVGVAVLFQVEDAEGAGIHPTFPTATPPVDGVSEKPKLLTVVTDPTGIARAEVKLGKGTGVWIVEAALATAPKEKIRFYITSGLRKRQSHYEAVVGSEVSLEVELALSEPTPIPTDLSAETREETVPLGKGKSQPSWQIIYRIIDEPPGSDSASLKNPRERVEVDDSGVEPRIKQLDPTFLELGDKPGIYTVVADLVPRNEAAGTAETRPYRGIVFRVVAMDWLFVILSFAAGMLLFVLGVRFVGHGALLMTSLQLQLVTTSAAGNRFLGYAVGAFNALICQSSTLVSSHLASLANGGLVTARHCFGLLAGATLGATTLPLFLAFEPGALAAPVLACGTVLFFYSRRTNVAAWASVCVGAGLILVGWNLLHEVAGLTALSESLKRDVLMRSSPGSGALQCVLGFFSYFAFGGAAGFLLRSSNLPAVLAMLLCVYAIISPATAVPLVLGGNLGASAMVFVATLRKRHEARRLALSGFLLQLVGCCVGIVLALVVVRGEPFYLWLVEWLTPGRLFPLGNNVGLHIAALHTLHNLLAGALVMIFPALTSRISDKVLPPMLLDQVKPHQLDPQLVSVPDLALQQAAAEVTYLTELGRKTVAEAFDAFRYQDLELAEQVVRRAETITNIHRDVSLFLLEVSENQLQRGAVAQVDVLQSAAESQMRIAELAEQLRDLAGRRTEDKIVASEDIERDLNEAYDLVTAQFDNILSLLKERDARTEENAAKMVERLAKFSTRVESHWRQRIQESEASGTQVELHLHALLHQEAFDLLFRIAAHLAHVAQRMRLFTADRTGF